VSPSASLLPSVAMTAWTLSFHATGVGLREGVTATRVALRAGRACTIGASAARRQPCRHARRPDALNGLRCRCNIGPVIGAAAYVGGVDGRSGDCVGGALAHVGGRSRRGKMAGWVLLGGVAAMRGRARGVPVRWRGRGVQGGRHPPEVVGGGKLSLMDKGVTACTFDSNSPQCMCMCSVRTACCRDDGLGLANPIHAPLFMVHSGAANPGRVPISRLVSIPDNVPLDGPKVYPILLDTWCFGAYRWRACSKRFQTL